MANDVHQPTRTGSQDGGELANPARGRRGVITASVVIKGPSDIQELSKNVGYAASAIHPLGIALACAGAWVCVLAANGSPRVVTREATSRGSIVSRVLFQQKAGPRRRVFIPVGAARHDLSIRRRRVPRD